MSRDDRPCLDGTAGVNQGCDQSLSADLHNDQRERIDGDSMSELTEKQKAFVEELPKNQWNGTKAAIAAGYSEKSGGVMACRLLKNPRVAAEIDKVKERYQKELEHETDITISEIVKRLNRVYHEAIDKGRYSDANKALELLGKYKAMFTDRHVNETAEVRKLTEREQEEARRITNILLLEKRA